MKLKALLMAFAVIFLVVFYLFKGLFRLVRVMAGWSGEEVTPSRASTQRA